MRVETIAGLIAGVLLGAALAALLEPESESPADRIRALANSQAPNP